MIYNSSDYNCDLVISEIQNMPLRVLLFKEDKMHDSVLSNLCDETKYNEKQNISGLHKSLDVYIVPIRYNQHDDESINHRVDYCDFAINILYERWCIENDKQIKQPYTSKTFMQYIEEIGFLSSDYAVIMA